MKKTRTDGLIGGETICYRRIAIRGGGISSRRPRGDTLLITVGRAVTVTIVVLYASHRNASFVNTPSFLSRLISAVPQRNATHRVRCEQTLREFTSRRDTQCNHKMNRLNDSGRLRDSKPHHSWSPMLEYYEVCVIVGQRKLRIQL